MLQLNLPAARNDLDEARRLGGSTKELRAAHLKLRQLEKEERARERAMYGGKIQPKSFASMERERETKKAKLVRILSVPLLPITYPCKQIYAALAFVWVWLLDLLPSLKTARLLLSVWLGGLLGHSGKDMAKDARPKRAAAPSKAAPVEPGERDGAAPSGEAEPAGGEGAAAGAKAAAGEEGVVI